MEGGTKVNSRKYLEHKRMDSKLGACSHWFGFVGLSCPDSPSSDTRAHRYRRHHVAASRPIRGANLQSYRWRQHGRGLFQTPMAA